MEADFTQVACDLIELIERSCLYDQVGVWHTECSEWRRQDFATVLEVDAPGASKVAADDKLKLQNYGRPYSDAGRPSGKYYSFSKRVGEFCEF